MQFINGKNVESGECVIQKVLVLTINYSCTLEIKL